MKLSARGRTSHDLVFDSRLRIVAGGAIIIIFLIIAKLFYIQVIQHEVYKKQASVTRSVKQVLKARRGEIFVRDVRAGQTALFPAALNRDKLILFSDNRALTNAALAAQIIQPFTSSTLPLESLLEKLSAPGRGYQVLVRDFPRARAEELFAQLDGVGVIGLYLDRETARFYPEQELLAHLTGFVGKDDKGTAIGRYGIEGFFDDRLHGVDGFIRTEKDPFGGWIPVADRDLTGSKDGDDVVLTIDRTLQLTTCEALANGVREYQAQSGTAIIMEPATGAILALCNVPTYDPNAYQNEKDAYRFQNSAIFRAYEPGSVFKAFTMSAALDAGAVTPDTVFVDTGSVTRDGLTIRNAANKSWGKQDMRGVIKNSINTGTVFVAEKLGKEKFRTAVERFGFGALTALELKSEVKGTIKSLAKAGSIYLATASFGQGITVTPLQLISGFATIANGGVRMQPQIVAAWRSPSGAITPVEPKNLGRVISANAAREITEMMRAVVQEGSGRRAQVKGYALAGKTGTAQIVGNNGKYLGDLINNHTFVAFGPVKNPRFVMLVLYERPAARYAEYTAVPTVGRVAPFLLQYLGIPPDL